MTDASDFIICDMLCYSNGTDRNARMYFMCDESVVHVILFVSVMAVCIKLFICN